jgi:chromosome segregation ATPase
MEPTEPDDRVPKLEAEVHRLNDRVRSTEQDAAAARILAGAADRDVSELSSDVRAIRGEVTELRDDLGNLRGDLGNLRSDVTDFRKATTLSFNAMRQDFVDLRQEMNTRFEQVDAGFTEMRGRLDGAAAGQAHIAGLLQRLIDDQKH